MNKYLKFIFLILISIITTFSLIVNIDINYIIVNKVNTNMFAYALIFYLLFKLYSKYYFKGNKNHPLYIFLSILLSIFITIGYSYNKVNSWDLCFSNLTFFTITIIKIIGYFFIINLIINKLEIFIKTNKKDINNNKIKKLFDDKPFKISLIIILICWLPYIISFFPAILSPDPSFQIKQFFGIETKYMDYALGYENASTITNHHPVLHTVILGGCVKIGHILFNSTNIGLFLYSIIQIAILSSVLAFTIKYMKKLNTPYYIRLVSLLIYSLVPAFGLYSISAVKDVIFSSLVILYMIMIYDLIKNRDEKLCIKNCLSFIILITLIMLMRNNGIYLIIMSFPFLFLINKKNILKLLIIFILPIIIYKSYTNILLPHFKINQGSVREMLSIPFQQTARYVKENKANLDKDEIKAIDKILDIETLTNRYKPEISDPVKNSFNKYSTKKELKDYFKVWFKGLTKRPDIYIQATLNNIYGYLTPNTSNWYVYYKYDKRLSEEEIFNYKYNRLSIPRKILSSFAVSFPYIPLIGLIVNIGFNVWVYMFMFISLLKNKKYKYLITITPMISLFLVCLASPVNTYFRYAMPYIFALPIMLSIYLNIINERSENNE